MSPGRTAASLEAELGGCRMPFQVRLEGSVPSTQDLVLELARGGEPEGRVVLAEEQSRGRGREGRAWLAPRGSALLLSVLLRPSRGREEWGSLSLLAGVALAEALAEVGGPTVQLKWPNDCLVGEQKLAGVLAEVPNLAGGAAVVLGIGCNLSWQGLELPPDLLLRATACDLEGTPVPAGRLAAALLRRLDWHYGRWLEQGFPAARDAWMERAAWLGEEVSAQTPQGRVRGRLRGVNRCGELLLATHWGTVTIAAGEVGREGPALHRASPGLTSRESGGDLDATSAPT
ncbi:MAG: biotin--[acetyl-CoA-carboxylase] ligase [Candidatus Dormibacteria bacterium]